MARPNYDPETGEPTRTGLATWQKLLAVLSVVLCGVGLAMGGTRGVPEGGSETAPGAAPMGTGAEGLQPDAFGTGLPGGTAGETPPPAEEDAPPLWAPLAAKGGLSFFLAFCIGYALRAALKVTMLVVGVLALAFFGLQYAGAIGPIDWASVETFWGDLSANLGTHFESAKAFVASSLPSAAAGGAGLVSGFRRS